MTPQERQTIVDAAEAVDVWDELPGKVRSLVEDIEGRPETWADSVGPAQAGRSSAADTEALIALAGLWDEDEDVARALLDDLGFNEDDDPSLSEVRARLEDDPSGRALLDEIERRYNPGQLRQSKGTHQGGQWRSISSRVMADLTHWLNNGGPNQPGGHDPLAAYSQPQLKAAATQLGLNPPKGMKLAPLKTLIIAHSQNAHAGMPGLPTPPAGARKVPLSVAGVPNVTATAVPVPARHLPTVRMHGAKQSQDIHLNGVHIGTVHQYTGSIGWMADDPNGNPSAVRMTGNTRTNAIQALLAAHQQQALTTSVPGAKLAPWSSPMSSAPGAASMNVTHHGADVGDIHSDSSGLWTAFPPNSSGYGLQGTPGSGQTYPSRDAAVQALVSAHNQHHAPAPPASPPVATPTTSSVPAKEALDVIYGVDPKSKTAARQLAVYGAMRRVDFDSLGAHEQSTLLGDLSYIATTSKGANAARAQKLIDRFTPPGTPSGKVPAQPFSVPPNAVAGQHRVTDPLGTPGMLKVLPASQRGQSGDGWTRKPDGSTGPWGKYGASGIMLRNVGSDGQAKYLMVERGPGISDPGKWQFPGGAMDQHENAHQGAAREVVEELGFKPSDMDSARVHGTHTLSIAGGWSYTSIAATVPTQLKPDLSTHHAQMETSDAKWMTAQEIDDLDRKGKLLKPLAGGQLQTNVMSLFPADAQVGRPGPRTTRPDRLTGTPPTLVPATKHKPSRGRDLIADTTSKNQLRQDVKKARPRFSGKVADDRLAAIGAMQGYDDTPTVVSKAEMDRLLASGDYIEAWRGVRGVGGGYVGPTRGGAVSRTKTAAQINEEFRTGPAFYGLGMYGNGYYFGSDRSIARGYSDGTSGSLLRVLIPKSAKIGDHSKVRAGARAASSPYSKAIGHKHEEGTLYDEGRFAAATGLDGIRIPHTTASHVAQPGKPAFNWLNRSVLIVQEA